MDRPPPLSRRAVVSLGPERGAEGQELDAPGKDVQSDKRRQKTEPDSPPPEIPARASGLRKAGENGPQKTSAGPEQPGAGPSRLEKVPAQESVLEEDKETAALAEDQQFQNAKKEEAQKAIRFGLGRVSASEDGRREVIEEGEEKVKGNRG